MSAIARQLSLQVAYTVSEDVQNRSVDALFGAIDRFHADPDLVDEHAQAQRSEATQRIAAELDRRNIRLRHPNVEAAAVAAIRARILPKAA